ncbi:MAG TPA: hypothetical protein DCR43_06355 [Bacteroidales bacterium]|nr:MAG: hypothetical protein A2X11_07775 [Bacteroidetes bacterium GWE2_42_24]OFY26465.1 MAG: hypothetical protein A2X09_02180 [Bacteroidetes bacterium GWF2_43_11]HAQ65455.1 hypothetical protein [Bacteroidales bacterium]HBZ68133.1 hypothetical protein [Bacteroidales bacterium]
MPVYKTETQTMNKSYCFQRIIKSSYKTTTKMFVKKCLPVSRIDNQQNGHIMFKTPFAFRLTGLVMTKATR